MMDWKDNTVNFPSIGTPMKTSITSDMALNSARKASMSSSLLHNTTQLSSSFAAPQTPAATTTSNTSGYRSVLSQMNEYALPGERRNVHEVTSKINIAPMPKELMISREKQRYVCTEDLLESERAFRRIVQERNEAAAMLEDARYHRFHASQDLLAIEGTGLAELVKKQRDHLAQLKTAFEDADNQITPGNRNVTDEEADFARVVRECNEAILCNRQIDLSDKFSLIVQRSGNHAALQLWRAFSAMIPSSVPSNSDHPSTFRDSIVFQDHIIHSAQQYLQQTCYESAASRFGPDNSTLRSTDVVQAYTRAQLSKHRASLVFNGTRVDELPVWPLVFYGLRMGAVHVAVHFAQAGDETTKTCARYLEEYAKNGGHLEKGALNEVEVLYKQAEASEDTFQKAVYSVLSKMETSENSEGVAFTVSDWLWMKLCQVSSSPKGFTYAKLTEAVRERFGVETADDAEAFLVYTLTGQFELGLERLFNNAKYKNHAVHMAITLKHLNFLLTTSDNSTENRLDFLAMIKSYVRPFRRQSPETAIEYYFHLTDVPNPDAAMYGHNFRTMFELCVYKLARDTRETWKLFGQFDANDVDGRLRKGLLHKFVSDPEAVMTAVAVEFEKDGRAVEAVRLLEIAEEKVVMLRVILRTLASCLSSSSGNEERRNLVNTSAIAVQRLQRSGRMKEMNLLSNVLLMLDLFTFFDLFDRKEYKKAVTVMQNLRVIPMDQAAILPAVEMYREHLLTETRRCIPGCLLNTMRALVGWYASEKDKTGGRRVFAGTSLELSAMSPPETSFSLHSNPSELQETFRPKGQAIMEYAQLIPAPHFPDFLDSLLKLKDSLV